MAVSKKTKKKSVTGAKKKVSNAKKKTSNSGSKNLKTVKKGTVKANKTVNKLTAVKNNNSKLLDKRLTKTYLSDKELKFFKELIVEQKNEILENARRLRESLIDNAGDYVGDNSTFSMHMAEQGSDEMEREKAYMFIQRDEKHLFYLENALERIGKKMYGLCISCGRPISKARLEAVPITSHCINCKQNLSS